MRTPPRLCAPEAKTLEEVLAACDEQRIVTFDAKLIMDTERFDLSLSYWKENYGDVPINRHSYRPDYHDAILEFLDRHAEDVEIDVRSLPLPKKKRLSALPGLPFQRDPVPLRDMIELLESRYAELQDVDDSFARARLPCRRIREGVERQLAFGVFNTRPTGIEWGFHDSFKRWRQTYNWLWFGLSFGTLHTDEFDNMLVQLSGKKVILLYERDFSDLIGNGGHYIRNFPPQSPLSVEAQEAHPCLGYIPYYYVTLEPGTGVTIPRRAYHAPLALSHDSVSLATFIRPYLKNERRELVAWARNIVMECCEYAYRFAGLRLMRLGPYEVF